MILDLEVEAHTINNKPHQGTIELSSRCLKELGRVAKLTNLYTAKTRAMR